MKLLKKNKYTLLSIATILASIGIGTLYLWHEGYIFTNQAQTAAVVAQNTSQTKTEAVTYPKPTREELLRLVNEERAKNGAAALTIDERLNQSAQRKADDMATYHYFAHTNPMTGKHGYEYINEVMKCYHASENLHWGTGQTSTASGAVGGWIGSAPHHTAMIDAGYTLTGFGISQDGEKVHVVEHFCQP